jgi:UDP-N-acetylmuramyl pentapeptide phosphotransferase/UDP-N-acetylglucosamine-1-phosphate transferase
VIAAAGNRPDFWRTNFRGERVNLGAGPALAVGATAGAVVGTDDRRIATAAAVAGLGAGLVGAYDDVVGNRPGQRASKGFAGHLAALRRGQLTAGVVKIVGIGAVSLAAAALLESPATAKRRRTVTDMVIDAGVIAGTANLVNLLDLRPGRAAKAGLLLGAPLATRGRPGAGVAAGAIGAAAAVLPEDLAERVMLGDTGANALGALLGTAWVTGRGRMARLAALAGVVGLNAASEKVSFTAVIARTPVLRELDALGRRVV